MTEVFADALMDAAVDTVKLIPFLFITYLVMEYLEDKAGDRTTEMLAKVGRFGPLFGGAAGILPQCGFSAAAASLYSGGVITAGTLLAVFLSTSDEMLPIFISKAVAADTIARILVCKAVLGAVTGLFLDFLLLYVFRRRGSGLRIHELCEQEHCGCEGEEEGGILKPALTHTFHITLFIFLITFVISFLVGLAGEETMSSFLTGKPVLGVFLAGIIGLIPNCAASVMITELYLRGLLGTGQMMTGLLVGAGVGLLVLFRTNRRMRDNLSLLGVLYASGVFWGLLIELSGITF
ncbi:MAG: arsenic efflux protein [Clostridium sp.]|nr:arsenic efflux protein [Clostridium sp.]MBO6150459.1 arsenic efflux protein [Clostridium sp.]